LKPKEPNRTQTEKMSQNRAKSEKNRANPKNQTETGRFEPVFVQKTKPKPVGLNRFWFGLSFFLKNLI
jgi:hypothetical protein